MFKHWTGCYNKLPLLEVANSCSWIWTCGSHIKTIGVFYTNTVVIYVLIFIKYDIRYLIQSSWLVSTYPCSKSFGLMDDHHLPLQTAALVQLLFVHSCFLSTYYILYNAENIYSYILTCTQLLLSLYWKCLPIPTLAPFAFYRIQCHWKKAVTAAGHPSLWGSRTSNCRLIPRCQSSWSVPAQD